MIIYVKLMEIQKELKAPKGQFNNFGKYKYRNCEDILVAVKPLLSQNKCILSLSDEIQHIEGRFYIKASATLVDAETGEKHVVSALAREPEDKKGMDSSQITGTASSYARKYALNGLFCIDDTKDADTDEYQKTTQNTTTKGASITDAQIKRAYAIASSKNLSNDDVHVWIEKKFGMDSMKKLSKKQYDELCSSMEKF